ncbi:septal ring lytic transglycosylase RlpA family protein [Hyphomonas adhaerens]|uniref:septal ring lytic transglycosylase RlpA family protein n=1 Tax=Hyphomonas adhaerens TaxID=81029 RepID=UPI002354F227|nr:septal ring lytic transglycosylase RlpA family protein [Hyphomonas adhaerens]
MKTVSSASKSLHLSSLVFAGAIAIAAAAPAHADKRTPAPIVYATGTSPYPAGKPQYIAPSRTPDAKQKKQARIQFRYPGSAQLPKSAAANTEQGAQYSEPAAREYASIEAPAPASTGVATSGPNSFDARAAAARIEAQRTVSAVESEALPSLQPTTAPAPIAAAPVAPPQQYQPAARSLTPAPSYAVSSEPVPVFDETSVAIVYGSEFNGLPTANGETFDPNAMTAAHPTLPLPSLIQVVNAETGREVVLRVNDRGPFEDGASLQVSPRAADELGMNGAGKATLRVRYLGAAPAQSAPTPPAPAPQMKTDTIYADAKPAETPAEYVTPASYEPAPQPRQAQPTYSYNAPVADVSNGDYFVQIGSFTDISNAQMLSNRVQASLPVTIVPARVNGADYFRVRVGPLLSRSEAERARADLSYAGISQGRIVTGE